jgi:7,8-dihydropterin-6-yl-methyl-4-(beta-D-ribofuranosyl)aminobenzene 5'-phosphate synthase
MRMTVLIENDAAADRTDLVAEFGLSLYFEAGGGTRILFDTGSSGAFADNAKKLGIDLGSVDIAVLSHHHFDHGGGLDRFFELNDRAPVYLRRAEHAERFFRFLGAKRPIGLDLGLFSRFPGRFIEISQAMDVQPGISLLTEAGNAHPRPRGNRHLKVRRGRRYERDDFDHELTMVLHEDDGMVVVTGCSHSGVLNMIDAAVSHFPNTRIKSVIGGFHLIGLPFFNTMADARHEVEDLARSLHNRCQGPVFTGHCTGAKALSVLGEVLGDQLHSFPSGTTVEL